jgi:hypothetical protein
LEIESDVPMRKKGLMSANERTNRRALNERAKIKKWCKLVRCFKAKRPKKRSC